MGSKKTEDAVSQRVGAPNETCCDHRRSRLVSGRDFEDRPRRRALLLEQNDEWQLQRRYMQLEGPAALSDNQAARLSAVIAG